MLKKFIKIMLLLIFLSIIYIYFLIINYMPYEITIFEGENISLNTFLGITYTSKEKTLSVSANTGKKTINKVGNEKISINLLDKFFIKDIEVSVLPKTTVIPVGNIAGVKLYTNGVLVVGMSEIEGEDQKIYKPYEGTNIEEGDTIVSVNNTIINSTDDLIEQVNNSKGQDIILQYIHDEQALECSIKPIKTGESEYKLGLWVRDSAAGVGTVTFYNPDTKGFAALGHGLLDIDTEQLINISSGEFVTANILDIDKGEKGEPGKIQGTLEKQKQIGNITQNTRFGIYGIVNDVSTLMINKSNEMEVALRDEIKPGKAEILCSLENGKIEKYEIEIQKIFKDNNYDNKSMKVRVTDNRLIEKTGGIIQGMSGSPIIQNGKFIGALTHVLVNEPLEGYAVFGDIMVKQMYKVNS